MDRARWTVKGGVNLRAWFGSLRYSEDLDLDVVSGRSDFLRERMDQVLAAKAFREMLATQGLTLTRSSKPKQTEKTQRWKLEVTSSSSSIPLHTRVEFSRRGVQDDFVLEPVRPDVVRPYGVSAPTVNHYTAASALRQKIRALATRSQPQARDVWDLDHLLRTTGAVLQAGSAEERRLAATAVERALEIRYHAFRSQVVPFLSPEHQDVFGTRDAWKRIVELVVDRLSELAP
ncbi:MAG TPA: nucleotidyl transferase AbiEii/AbiGii toxin family protein [Vicinamibacteria bacterium]|nr:nucleotidyl transferase AbiEii/AbiGii toxin family protein [Vicinamibacteria bacterium]